MSVDLSKRRLAGRGVAGGNGRSAPSRKTRSAGTPGSRLMMPTASSASAPATTTLYDVPVSNNGARCRIAIYAKGIEGDAGGPAQGSDGLRDCICIESPGTLGGLKSDDYARWNPFGKMPMLRFAPSEAGTADGGSMESIYESQVILEYLIDKYQHIGPSLIQPTPELRAHSSLGCRVFDTYIQPIQGAMYKPMDASLRADGIAQIDQHLKVLESLCMAEPFFSGAVPGTADCTLLPSFVFFVYILENKFGWKDLFYDKPKLKAWYSHLVRGPTASADASDAFLQATRKVHGEVRDGLVAWDEGGRWERVGVQEQITNNPMQLKWKYP